MDEEIPMKKSRFPEAQTMPDASERGGSSSPLDASARWETQAAGMQVRKIGGPQKIVITSLIQTLLP